MARVPDWMSKGLRAALSEQARVVETRAEAAAGAASELGEYCRRRSELEAEYARALDKLARASAGSNDDTAGGAAVAACARHARTLARDHAALGALYGGALASRAARASEHAQRLARRARELLHERQEELAGALLAAASAAKAHAAAAATWRAHANKLRDAQTRQQALLSDPSKSKKLRALDKELDKRRARYIAARAHAAAARHEHALALDEANAALQRYYSDDIADIMLCTEVGYEAAVSCVARTAAAGERALAGVRGAAGGALAAAAQGLHGGGARRTLLHTHRAFAPPAPQPPPPDCNEELAALVGPAAPTTDDLLEEARQGLAAQCAQYEAAADAARLHCQEAAKTLDAAETELLRQMEGAEVDVSKLFGAGAAGAGVGAGVVGAGDALADDTPRRDQEDYYLAKVRAYVRCAGRVSRLEARAGGARALLGGAVGGPRGGGVPRRGARGLFAAPLQVDRVPRVLDDCVRVISTHGLRAQGIFRVCGAHAEVAALRAAYERGQAALAGAGPQDVHAVCTLLKLWLRSLRPPLLPPALHTRLLAARDASTTTLSAELKALPPAHMVALRYLCAFLAHCALHSSRTRMDAWNLAICLGPTLLVASGAPPLQVAAQNALNHLLKRLIEQHEQLFPQEVVPAAKYSPPRPATPPDTPPPDEHDHPALHDTLELYVDDDDDEVISEEEGVQWCDEISAPPTPAPVPLPALPVTKVPPPTPPRRCESSGGTRAMDALQSPTARQRLDLHLSVSEGPAAPPLSTPEPPLTPLESPDTPLESPGTAEAPPLPSDTPSASTRLAVEAPDLVFGLPAETPPAPPLADPADTFAHNSDTLKKRPSSHRTAPDEPPTTPRVDK